MNKIIQKPYTNGFPTNPQSIGDQIRKVRMDRGLLQKDVAKLIQVSEDTITGWENGRSEPQVQFYPRIISFLGFDPCKTDKRTIGDLVKAYRLKAGISQKKLGESLGVNGSTISDWENGNYIPKSKFIKKLEVFFKG